METEGDERQNTENQKLFKGKQWKNYKREDNVKSETLF